MFNYKDLLKAGIHFGHNTSRWSPKMSSFIWGARNKVHLIDISKTAFLLERAGKYVEQVASEGKSVLWIGTKKAAQKSITETAQATHMPSVIHRWIGGTLSNFDQVKKAITRLLHLRDVVKKSISNYGKKEQSMITKEVARLEKNVGGIIDLEYPPGVIVVIDAKKERSAIKEALGLGLPVIAVVDTNTDPTGIPFIIPANDDSPRSIEFILKHLGNCVQAGIAKHKEAKAAEKEAKAAAKKTADKKETKGPKTDSNKKEAKSDAKATPKKEAQSEKKTAPKKEATKDPSKKKVVKKTATKAIA